MGGAEYKLAPCATLAHPRALRGVIDEAEREHLTRIYFDRVHDRSSLTYYNLLGHLAREKADGASWDIVERIGARVRAELGEGYTLINDFFSYRAQGLRLFPSWHQDGEYWLADDGTAPAGMACGGFNLWVLLAHERMNYSFDVLEVESNKWMYDALYARQYGLPDASHAPPRPLYRPAEFAQLSRARGLRAFVDAAEPRSPRVTNVPLEAGDALLLRQVELHRTDTHELPPDQWRLALGFMVLRGDTFVRDPNPASPFGDDAARVRLGWPGLLPEFRKGRSVPCVYNRTRVLALDPRMQRPAWLAWLLSDAGLLVAAPPLAAAAVLACVALAAAVRRRRGATRRGRRLDDNGCIGALLPDAHSRRRAE
ncbi:hypothetical protein KFE25_004386 [Diacronema lutheri]|uniref:Uncharacterized protein n=1 Tax=Diacronema lutheri TaxID=2081491 RepID=A0A8J5X405_DIALT|nr:hypothetical protein KFE25_004386 [Diacronema lutheri]